MYENGYWQPFAPHILNDSAYEKENTEIYTGVCAPTSEPTTQPTVDPTTSAPTTSAPTSEPTIEFCCSNIAWQNKWVNRCPNFGTKPACERLTGAQGNNRCKWMNCALVGDCNYITGSSAGSQKVCKKLTSQDDCEAKAFCEWEFTNTLQMDDSHDMSANIQFVDNVHNNNIKPNTFENKGKPLYLLFILLTIGALICYIWKRYNNILSKDKYVGTEYESLLSKV